MGWETRSRGGRYYTRSRKVGGRVMREYVGEGLVGEMAAETDALMREQRRLDALAWREERERLGAIERGLVAYCRAVGELARERLKAAGYHQHARGEWRRKRVAKTTDKVKARGEARTGKRSVDTVAMGGERARLEQRMDALMAGAQAGDSRAMDDLRPALHEAWGAQWEDALTGPAEAARSRLLEATMGSNLLAREAWERRAKALQRDLEGPAPMPLERILCERVATCWLDTQLADLAAASRGSGRMALTVGEYWQRRQERAQRRYLDAALALARVRRLLAPVVAQVNIAQAGAQQLNVALPTQEVQQG